MSRIKVTDACQSLIGTFSTLRHCVVFGRMLHRRFYGQRTEKRPVSIRSRGVERDCRSIVNQLVSSMPKEVLLRTSFTEYGTLNQNQTTEEVRIRSKSRFTRSIWKSVVKCRRRSC